MIITKLPNGDLEMQADVNERQEIAALRRGASSELAAEAQFIADYLSGDPMGDGRSYQQVAPEEVGALTSAPIISDGESVWGFMNYQVENFLETLASGETATWQKG